MASSPLALTLILGPPARTEEREAFDRLQAAIGSGHTQEAEVCERRQAEYFADLFRPEAGTPSIMDELLSAFLGSRFRRLKPPPETRSPPPSAARCNATG